MQKKQQLLIKFSNSFNKDRKVAPTAIKIALRDALEIFRESPNNSSLRNHSLEKLGKRYFGLRSINVTDDWRAIYRKKENEIIFIMLNTHIQLYT